MRRILAAAAVCLSLATPALADGKIYVRLPDLSAYQGRQAELLLERVVLANVVSSNCLGYEVSEEEWSLLVDSGAILAHQLDLDAAEYDARFYRPAFDQLDDPLTCQTGGPSVQPILDELVRLGGSREALPDQAQAYRDYKAMEARWAREDAERP